MVGTQRSRSRRGFTILEILIAIVILVLGISGIVALFPTAIESGNQTVQDSYAAAITQSVVDALAVGVRESHYGVLDGQNPPRRWDYFIFDHDGVYDKMVPSPQAYTSDPNIAAADWCILLPQGKDPNMDPAQEPWFVYPSCPNKSYQIGDGITATVPDPHDNHIQQMLPNLSNPAQSDDWSPQFIKPDLNGVQRLWIRRVYMLGRYREGQNPSGVPERGVRDEFLGDPEGVTGGGGTAPGANYQNRPVVDPYPQYSFAIALRRAKIDNGSDPQGPSKGGPDGVIDMYDHFSSSLYEVHVMVFRNFDGTTSTHAAIGAGQRQIPRSNIPIREFVTLMSL